MGVKTSMNIFDSHCHLDDRSYAGELGDIVNNARASEVYGMMTVGVNLKSSKAAVDIANRYSGCYASVGVHPHDVKRLNEEILDSLLSLAQNAKVKAWGEIGLDFNRMFSPRKDQEHWFARQLETAESLGTPVILHERDSGGRLLEILETHFKPGMTGVVHCFSGTHSELKAYLDMGLYIGVTGVVTLKKRGGPLRKMIADIPDQRLLIETDAPYLTPAPEKNRYRRNEPAFVRSVLYKIAEIRQTPPEQLSELLWHNTCRLFNIPAEEPLNQPSVISKIRL